MCSNKFKTENEPGLSQYIYIRDRWKKSLAFSYAAAAAKSFQLCLTLCNPTDGSPPGSPVPGILQARTLEWVAISFSSAWKMSSITVPSAPSPHGLRSLSGNPEPLEWLIGCQCPWLPYLSTSAPLLPVILWFPPTLACLFSATHPLSPVGS